jgi:hypothetical protein
MAIQWPNIQRISFNEANPGLMGASAGLGLVGQGQDILTKLLAQQKAQAELPYAGQLAQADTAYKVAMAKYLSQPNQMLKYMSPLGKTYVEQKILGSGAIPNAAVPGQMSSPDQMISQGQGNQLADQMQQSGSSVPDDIGNTYQAYRQKTAFDANQSHQAQAAQIIYNQVNDIDTKPLEKFSGLGGHLEAMKERAKGVASSLGFPVEPSQDWRDYNAYMSVNKNTIMDAIRKALVTTVMPGYVMATLQPMTDPSAPIWNDPAQVRKNIETLKAWIKPYAGEQTEAMAKGVPTTLGESEKRHESYMDQPNNGLGNSNSIAKQMNDKNAGQDEGIINIKAGQKTVKMMTPDGKQWNVPIGKVSGILDSVQGAKVIQ